MKSIVGGILNRTPVSYVRDKIFEPSRPFGSDREKDLGTMESDATLFAIVDSLASDVAAVEWNLYRGSEVAANPIDEDPKTIVSGRHPAKSVWEKPNPYFTQDQYIETLQQHYELTGEKWNLLVRPGSSMAAPPVELWPVRPDRMMPVPHSTEFIAGYLYKPKGSFEKSVALEREQVMMVRRPNPLSMYRGLGPLGTLMIDLEGEQAASEWNAAFFRNGAEPGGIIEVPELMSDEDFKRMQEHWESQHKGVRNAHRVAVVEVGQWKDRKFSMRDMQFEQLRRFTKERIRTAWRYPKPMLGDVEDVNRANADAGLVIYAQRLLVPRLNRWRTMLNQQFLPMFGRLGRDVHFNYADPVPPNRQQEGQNRRLDALNAASFVQQGFDPSQTLEAFGFPAIDWLGPPKDRFALENQPEETAGEPGEEDENPESSPFDG